MDLGKLLMEDARYTPSTEKVDLSVFDSSITLAIYLLSLNLAVIIFVNFTVFVLIWTSKPPVPSSLLSFILYLITATH